MKMKRSKTIGQKIIRGMNEFADKLARGEPIMGWRVERKPDGTFERKRVRVI